MYKYKIYYEKPIGDTAKIIEARMNIPFLADVSTEIKFSGKRTEDKFNLIYKTPHRESPAGGRTSVILEIELLQKESGTEILICMKRSKLINFSSIGLSLIAILSAISTMIVDNKATGIVVTLIFGTFFLLNIMGSINLYQRVLIGIQGILIKDANNQR